MCLVKPPSQAAASVPNRDDPAIRAAADARVKRLTTGLNFGRTIIGGNDLGVARTGKKQLTGE